MRRLVVLLLLCACSDALPDADGGAGGDGGLPAGGEGGGGGATGSVEADFCAPLAAFVCTRARDCGCASALNVDELDLAACTARWTARCLDAYAPVVAAVEAGTAVVDAGAARTCVGLLEERTPGCERPRGAIPQGLCPAWFHATASGAAGCALPFCDGGAGRCELGRCIPRETAGEACDGATCAPGLLCVDGACTAPAAAGAPCEGDLACDPPLRCVEGACGLLRGAGEACAGDTGCGQGLRCAGGICTEAPGTGCTTGSCGHLEVCAARRRCLELSPDGGSCDVDEACAPGLACFDGTCGPLPGAGAPCVRGTFCAPGLGCTEDNGVCAPLPGDGEACLFGPGGPFACAAGLGCVDGTCGPLPGADEPCTGDGRCAAGLTCEDFTRCRAPAAEGRRCERDDGCGAGLYCAGGTCEAKAAAGAPCTSDAGCETGACVPGSAGGGVCAPAPAAGEACTAACADGRFCGVDPEDTRCAPDVCLEL